MKVMAICPKCKEELGVFHKGETTSVGFKHIKEKHPEAMNEYNETLKNIDTITNSFKTKHGFSVGALLFTHCVDGASGFYKLIED